MSSLVKQLIIEFQRNFHAIQGVLVGTNLTWFIPALVKNVPEPLGGIILDGG